MRLRLVCDDLASVFDRLDRVGDGAYDDQADVAGRMKAVFEPKGPFFETI